MTDLVERKLMIAWGAESETKAWMIFAVINFITTDKSRKSKANFLPSNNLQVENNT